VVFLSVESLREAIEVATALEANFPGIQMIALGRSREAHILEELLRTEVREFLSLPFRRDLLVDAIKRAQRALERKPPVIGATDRIYSFLPAKAGVGASTIALNASIAAATIPGAKVLLSDFDLCSGVIQFMLKMEARFSVIEAATRASEMDENIWAGLVASTRGLDVLGPGDGNPYQRLEPVQVKYLLDFARRQYQMLCIDLSGNLEQYAIEAMQESKRIFLVCTPELPSMYLARKKYALLQSLDLGERVSLLLNRYQQGSSIGPKEVENMVGTPVLETFPNDYKGVHHALTLGKQVGKDSSLGRKFTLLSDLMAERKTEADEPRSALGDLFSSISKVSLGLSLGRERQVATGPRESS
jgi:pilus assembly protein CpaE